MNDKPRYSIYCPICGTDVYLRDIGGGDFQCPICEFFYDTEDGVKDLWEAEEQERLYSGAVKAGLINERKD